MDNARELGRPRPFKTIVYSGMVIGPRTTVEPLGSVLNSFVGHAILVGLPVALIAGWSARRNTSSN